MQEVISKTFTSGRGAIVHSFRKDPITFEGNIVFVNRKFFSKTSNNYKKLHNKYLIRQKAYDKAYENKQKQRRNKI